MSRLTQLGVFCVVLGGVVLFLSLFPSAVEADSTPGVGVAQILGILTALSLIVLGAYVVAYDLFHRGRPGTLIGGVGIRLGLTGMMLAAASTLADTLGFGSHTPDANYFGRLQVAGLLIGFGIAAIGVLIYGLARP